MKNYPIVTSQAIQLHKKAVQQIGVSLFELMAVVFIIGVLSSIGIVSFKPLWQKHQLSQSTNNIEEQIQLLRLKSIIENCTFEMKFDQHHLVYRKKQGQDWGNWRRYRLNEAAEYSMSGSIYFDNKGFTSPKTITIKMLNGFQQLIININGRVRKSEIL